MQWSSHQAGTRVFRSLGLSRYGTIEVFPAASHTPEPGIQQSCGFLNKVQIILPCETYIASHCFPPSLSLPSHIIHTLERKERRCLPGRGEVGKSKKIQEQDIYDPSILSPGEACSSSQGHESKNRIRLF